VPNVTHVVSQAQPLYFFYEIYDPSTGLPGGDATDVSSSISLFRGPVRAFETPPINVQSLTSKERKAIAFQVQVPPASLPPGLYTCQVTLIDGAARKFAFSRFQLFVQAGSPRPGA